MSRTWFMLGVMVIGFLPLGAQTRDIDALVASKVRALEEGRAGEVKVELPTLVSKYQNHPGVLYLQGRLATDGVEAARHYQTIMDNFPRSEWADDALYRIYLYYYSLGLVRTAGLKMKALQHDYPNSPYAKERFVARVTEIETQPEKQPEITPSPIMTPPPRTIEPTGGSESSGASYALQVGAFASVANAMKLKSYFEELGYPVEVQNKVRGGRSLHLVWVGRFGTAEEARKFGAEVRAKHKMESIVVPR